jgi:hypothetical protein
MAEATLMAAVGKREQEEGAGGGGGRGRRDGRLGTRRGEEEEEGGGRSIGGGDECDDIKIYGVSTCHISPLSQPEAVTGGRRC